MEANNGVAFRGLKGGVWLFCRSFVRKAALGGGSCVNADTVTWNFKIRVVAKSRGSARVRWSLCALICNDS